MFIVSGQIAERFWLCMLHYRVVISQEITKEERRLSVVVGLKILSWLFQDRTQTEACGVRYTSSEACSLYCWWCCVDVLVAATHLH